MSITTGTEARPSAAHSPTVPGVGADFDDFDGLDDFELPPVPEFTRCGLVRAIHGGPWVGTLVSCVRRGGHGGEHAAELGDPGTRDHWRESWS